MGEIHMTSNNVSFKSHKQHESEVTTCFKLKSLNIFLNLYTLYSCASKFDFILDVINYINTYFTHNEHEALPRNFLISHEPHAVDVHPQIPVSLP